MNPKDIPAFPVTPSDRGGYQYAPTEFGMTLRDYFAAKAMQSIVTHPSWENFAVEKVAQWAYEQADAMLAARGDC